jgi:hypothetical protein
MWNNLVSTSKIFVMVAAMLVLVIVLSPVSTPILVLALKITVAVLAIGSIVIVADRLVQISRYFERAKNR